jgi:mannosyltransferase
MKITVTSKKTLLLLTIICIIAALIRFYLLGKATFWLDETVSWEWARSNLANTWKTNLKSDPNMIFYYLLLRPWLYLGENEWIIRSLSVIFGIAIVPIVYLLGKRLFGQRVGLISACLITIHAFLVRFSQEARSYSLLVFLLVLSTYYFVRAVESPKERKFWILYIAISTLAVYAHLLAIFVIAAQVLSLGPRKIKEINTFVIIKVLMGLIILIGPFIISSWFFANGNTNWITQPTSGKLLNFIYALSGNYGIKLLICYIILILIAVILPDKISTSGNSYKLKWNVRLMILWITFPIISLYLISFIKPMLIERYLLMCVPPLIILSSYGLEKLNRTFLHTYGIFPVSLTIIIILSLLGLKKYFDYRNNNINEWIPLANHILSTEQAGDCIFYTFDCASIRYYTTKESKETSKKSLPASTVPFPPTLENYEYSMRNYKRMWLITELKAGQNQRYLIDSVLSGKFELKEKKTFSGFGINTWRKNIVSELYIKK